MGAQPTKPEREEADEVIGIEFNPVRCGFPGGDDVWLADVLNVGVRPERLIHFARQRFEASGGVVLERTPGACDLAAPRKGLRGLTGQVRELLQGIGGSGRGSGSGAELLLLA